jgi:hypothetical protein
MNSDCQLNRIGSKELDPPSHSLLQLVEVRLQLPEVLALRPQRSSERPATGSVAISKTVGAPTEYTPQMDDAAGRDLWSIGPHHLPYPTAIQSCR